MRKLLALTALLVVAGWQQTATARTDTVQVRGQPPLSGMVTKDNVREVTIRSGVSSQSQTFSQSDVEEVRYGSLPTAYILGIRQYETGNYKEAYRKLRQTLQQIRTLPEPFRQYPYYYAGAALRKMGRLDDALKFYEALLEMMPDTRFLPQIVGDRVQIYIAKGETRKALKEIDILKKYDSKGATLLKGAFYEQTENYSKAMSEYRKLRTASGEMGDVARVAEARCMARMGSRLSQARDQVKAVLNDRGTKTDKVYAQAHVVLGNIKLQQAKESGKSEDVKAALLEYLRVILLYSDQETAMPEALYQAAKACDLLGDAGRRAQQYRTQLQRSFSDSSWARKL